MNRANKKSMKYKYFCLRYFRPSFLYLHIHPKIYKCLTRIFTYQYFLHIVQVSNGHRTKKHLLPWKLKLLGLCISLKYKNDKLPKKTTIKNNDNFRTIFFFNYEKKLTVNWNGNRLSPPNQHGLFYFHIFTQINETKFAAFQSQFTTDFLQ